MANFTPSRKTAQDFNGGVEYVDQDLANNIQGDYVNAKTVNNLVESALYTQVVAEGAVDTVNEGVAEAHQIANDGIAEVTRIANDGVAEATAIANNIQGLANNPPDITYIADEGAPSVEIKRLPDNTPQFVFSHLKGQKGDKGDSGIGVATSSMFWLYVTDNGDLYVKYNEGSTPPQFRLDENKNLYYII